MVNCGFFYKKRSVAKKFYINIIVILKTKHIYIQIEEKLHLEMLNF